MLNTKCRGSPQSLLPLPNWSRKIEGDSAHRVGWCQLSKSFTLVIWPLSTLLIIAICHVSLFQQHNPTVSLETRNLFMIILYIYNYITPIIHSPSNNSVLMLQQLYFSKISIIFATKILKRKTYKFYWNLSCGRETNSHWLCWKK